MNRRELLKNSGFAAAFASAGSAASPARADANSRIGVGFIGVGGMGTSNLRDFMRNSDVETVAVCDVHRPTLEQAVARTEGKAKSYADYRKLLEDPNVDAVVISTPEHWHAVMCIDACNAGKDVYVEKPASHYIRDGRLMVEAARRNKRVVQVGSQQRSGAHFQRAMQHIHDGKIGDVYYVAVWNHSSRLGGPGRDDPSNVLADLDWDMWLGPAPQRPYEPGIWETRGRKYWNFYGGMLTEWGAHLLDVALWGMKAKSPRTVAASGGQFFDKDGEIPDTLSVNYEFDGFLLNYSVLRHNSFGHNGSEGAARFGSYGTQFHGAKGTLFVDRQGYTITPQPLRKADPKHPAVLRAAGEEPGEAYSYYARDIEPEHGDTSDQHFSHVRNFLNCVKSRKTPNADIEVGHYTNTACRLGNIAYRVGRRLTWDAAKEEVAGDPEANKLVVGTYREPWAPKGI